MQIAADAPRVKRSIGGKPENGGDEVRVEALVPQPFAAGPVELTEGMASALNQIVAENLSNNLRAKIVSGVTEGEGDSAKTRPYTADEAQKLVDEYLAEYELGVRRTGSGERQVTDPVEREARKIAREKARELIKANGGKPGDYDLGPIVDGIFEANKDLLMAEGKKIVERANKAAQGLNLEGISLTPKAPAAASTDSAGEAEAEPEAATA